MEILFRRTQYTSSLGKVKFKLWGRIELDETERKLLDLYDFRKATMLGEPDYEFMKFCIYVGIAGGLVSGILISIMFGLSGDTLSTSLSAGTLSAPFMAVGAGFWFYHSNREIIYVRDLLHGRTFKCSTVVDLVQKEAMLESASFVLRQVLEESKQWDGTEKLPIKILPRDEAKEVILRAFPSAS